MRGVRSCAKEPIGNIHLHRELVTTLPSAKKVRPLGEVQNKTANYWNCDTVIEWFRVRRW